MTLWLEQSLLYITYYKYFQLHTMEKSYIEVLGQSYIEQDVNYKIKYEELLENYQLIIEQLNAVKSKLLQKEQNQITEITQLKRKLSISQQHLSKMSNSLIKTGLCLIQYQSQNQELKLKCQQLTQQIQTFQNNLQSTHSQNIYLKKQVETMELTLSSLEQQTIKFNIQGCQFQKEKKKIENYKKLILSYHHANCMFKEENDKLKNNNEEIKLNLMEKQAKIWALTERLLKK